jgi:NAD(P)H dehydrogenase (quinone)
MSKILVTGSTGNLGGKTVEHLFNKIPTSDIIAFAKEGENADLLIEKGIEVRYGDYFNYDSLLNAFKGVDKIMLVGSHGFTDRITQHYNVIAAARQAGVKHIHYTSIMRKEGSKLIFPEITESDVFTEHALRASGLAYTILFQPPFADVLPFYYGFKPLEDGFNLTEGKGKFNPATRDDLGEAQAEILSTSGHENKSYLLAGSEAISFHDIAETISELNGQKVAYNVISEKEYVDRHVAAGIPQNVAEFVLVWVKALNDGEYAGKSDDIERFLGRKTTPYRTFLESVQPANA